MRNGQNKRMRGRNRRGHNPLTRVYESNGPDVKIRGTAHHVAEKYLQLARDAQSSGDPVAAEGYLQHAEHYFRLIAAAQAQFAQQNPHHQHQQPQFQRPDLDPRDDFDDGGDDLGSGEQPSVEPQQAGAPPVHAPQPQPQPQPHHHQPQPQRPPYPPREHEGQRGGLPAFITGGGGPNTQGNGYDNEPGERGDRFGRRRRRFRPRGPYDFEPRGEPAGNAPAPVEGTASEDTQPGDTGVPQPKSGE
jgi:hypothetical protein